MKNSFTSTFLAIALGLQQATANGAWSQQGTFGTPDTCNNVCTKKQGSGFDFAELAFGTVEVYDGFSFTGFSCKSFGGRKIGRSTTQVSL